MKTKLKSKWVGVVAALVVIGIAWVWQQSTPPAFTVTFFNVGQGDAALVRTVAGQTILVDGGPDRTILSKLGAALPWGERTIDLVILSHPHADHVSGLNYVLERYRVRQVLVTGAVHTTPEYLRFLELLKEQGLPVALARAGQTVELAGGVRVEVLWPQESFLGKEVPDLNATSIVNRVVYGSTAVLFTGDTPEENESSLLASGAEVEAQLLKVAHQGSRTSSSPAFLRAVSPQVAVISVGQNSYGHPHAEVVERLRELVPQVLRTDEEDDITFMSDGQSFTRQRPHLPFLQFVLP
ncbi:MAG: ComEC/Rec2 family competence protein [Candidatus Veblenbacteria bacterium]|nr:ComEC/Rec2 family competence protein [Candidatus Veblenbacteria bacterium]MDZ4230146.1 ComEC/Rec2 family competence protein [Candidatus Veblenbacteria bacterium]